MPPPPTSAFQPGDIHWLLPSSQLSPTILSNLPLDPNALDHPVVIISPPSSSATSTVEILILSSLAGKTLSVYAQSNPRLLYTHLPISPAPSAPSSPSAPSPSTTLHLADNLHLPKHTYVKTDSTHTIPLSLLHPSPYMDEATGLAFKLTPGSVRDLWVALGRQGQVAGLKPVLVDSTVDMGAFIARAKAAKGMGMGMGMGMGAGTGPTLLAPQSTFFGRRAPRAIKC